MATFLDPLQFLREAFMRPPQQVPMPAPNPARVAAGNAQVWDTPQAAPAQAPQQQAQPMNEDLGGVLAGPRAAPQAVPGGLSDEMAIRKIMLQAGLNLMVPQWGDGISQIGQALGAGAEAVSNSQQVDQENQLAQTKQQTELIKQQAMQALTEQREESAETSRSKRLKGESGKTPSTEFERITNQLRLGPKGKLYLKERMKAMDDITDPDSDLDPAARFEKWVLEAQGKDGSAPAGAPADSLSQPQSPIGTVIEDSAGVKWKKTTNGPDTDKRNFTQVK